MYRAAWLVGLLDKLAKKKELVFGFPNLNYQINADEARLTPVFKI